MRVSNQGSRVGFVVVTLTAFLAVVPGSHAQTDLYVANLGSDDVSVVDANTDQVTATIPVGNDPDGIAVLPNGTAVFVANFLGDDVSVIDPTTHSVSSTIPVASGPVGVAAAPDGSRVYVANRESNSVSVIDTAALRVVANVGVGEGPNGIAVRPDGGVVYVTNSFTNAPGVVSVIDAASNQVVDVIAVNHSPGRVAFTPDGELAYVTNYRSHNVSVIDAHTHDVVATVPVAGRATNIAFSPDGSLAYVTTLGGRINVIETTSHSLVANIEVGVQPYAIAALASGDRAYTADLRSDTSTVIETIDLVAGGPIAVGTAPFALAIRCVATNCAAPPLTPRPTRTATPSATITSTPRPTSTARPSSTPRPTRTAPPPPVMLNISSAPATEDDVVIEISLQGDNVSGFQNDIIFNHTVLSLQERDCTINPAIGLSPLGSGDGQTTCFEDTEIGPCKNLGKAVRPCTGAFDSCTEDFGPDYSVFRGVLAGIAAPNDNEIPPGLAYTCKFRVLNRAALPAALVGTNAIASDPAGNRLDASINTGQVLPGDVSSPQSVSASGSSGGGCMIDRGTAPSPAWYLTLLPPLVLVRRRVAARRVRR